MLVTHITKKRLKLIPKTNSVTTGNLSSQSLFLRILTLINSSISLSVRRAKKFDFCKCTFPEMKKMIKNIVRAHSGEEYLPVVAIGHSKNFIHEEDLRNLLSFIESNYAHVIEVVPLTHAVKKYKMSLLGIDE